MFSKRILKLPKDRSLTLLIGIPATGKSFLANKMKAINSKKRIIISSDKIRRAILDSKNTKIYFNQVKEGEIWNFAERKVYDTLLNPEIQDCVLDAVNMTYFSRFKFIQMAKDLGLRTRGILLYRPLKKILRWNINRKYPISESKIKHFFKHFDPPVKTEFDKLIKIGSLKKFQKERRKMKVDILKIKVSKEFF